MPDLSDTLRKCRIGTAKKFTLLLLLYHTQAKIAGILLTMYQSRPQLCQSVRATVGEVYGEAFHVFERPIEQTIKVAECPAAGMSILDYAPKNPAAESYRSLAREVLSLG